jgi:hypothetical protein
MKMSRLFFAVLVLFFATVAMMGQSLNTSQVSGTVQDGTGAFVPNATVVLTNTATGFIRTVTSNASGSYTAPDLPLGPYTVTVTADGFDKYVEKGLVLEVGSNPEINPKLTVGTISQEVVVEANAGVTVETESNGVGTVINQRQVVELPLNGRDPTQLIALAGATTAAPAGDLNSNKNFPTVTLSVAGGLPNGIAYVLDGGTYNDVFNNLNLPIPFPDALQEFKSETSSLPAQYGNHASAAINAITKSGGNKFHGDLFEFVRNYAFNAANYFGYNTTTGAKVRDNLKRNQFGGVIGGPIKTNKIFFFAGYQGTIIRAQGTPTLTHVPTQSMLNGDFNPSINANCFGKAITLGGAFAGNKINPASYNQQALNVIKAGLPVTNDDVNNPCGNHFYTLSQNSTGQAVIGRVDWTIGPQQTAFVRYNIARFNSPVTETGTDITSINQVAQFNQDQSAVIGDTYNITPHIINSARLTGNRTLGQRSLVPFFDPGTLGIADYVSPNLKGFMGITITNGFSLGQGGNNPGYFNSTQYQLVDDVNIVRGNHQITFGGNYLFAYMNTVNNRPTNGAFTFAGTVAGGGSVGYADFLLGDVSGFSQGNADYENDVYNYVGAYVQDSWKANKHLTLNYGLRWEPYIPFWNRNSHAENFTVAGFTAGAKSVVYPNAPAGLTFPGDAGFPGRSYNAGKKNDFAPRIGFIFTPGDSGKTSIRAGYGLFYDTPQMFFDTRYSNAPPFGQTVSLSGNIPFSNPWANYAGDSQNPAGTDPFPNLTHLSPATPFVTGGTYVNTPIHYHPEYLQQWNLSVQHQAGNWLFASSYLGNKTTHLVTAYEANPGVFIAGTSTGLAGSCGFLAGAALPKAGVACSSTSNTQARRYLNSINPTAGASYATIGTLDDGGIASYNGLLSSVQRRTKSTSLIANYTYAHCLSEAETTELTGPSYIIPGNRHASYSNCDSDRRHVANVSFVYNMPHLRQRFADLVLGGWGVSTIFTARSGGYFTPTTGVDNALSGISGQIGTVTGNPYGPRTRTASGYDYLTPTGFATNFSTLTGVYSTAAPLTIHGPGSYELDMALLREFHVTESQHVQFRWEVFNVPNEAIFTTLTTAQNSGTFGYYTAADNPRIMQFALKYIF